MLLIDRVPRYDKSIFGGIIKKAYGRFVLFTDYKVLAIKYEKLKQENSVINRIKVDED